MSNILKRFQLSTKKALSTTRRKVAVIATAVAIGSTNASAALTAPTIDTGDFTSVAGAVLVAVGVFFGIRKALQLLK